ncbi:helix-turn-helix domain-containing protein [Streptosporangium sp. DT93]|uniref:helix-turn-helix domain-containing protein n=1 Tax=Streptosporangium sp. DT93 TaxID=3393428 RepID=UPI003CED51F8
MVAEHNPTLRRRRLGGRLRVLREEAGLTVEQAAEALLCTPSKISRIENAQRGASQRDVRDLCAAYGISDEELIEQLMTLARETRKPGLKYEHGDLGDDALYTYMELEAGASSITEFQTAFFPGLLQTEDYARALIQGLLPRMEADVLERRVAARMARQRALLERADPPRYWTFIDEAVLHRQVGSFEIMKAQLERVLTVAGNRHVTVQFVPFRKGAYMGAGSPFVFLEMGKDTGSDVVYIETLVRNEYFERPDDLKVHREAIDQIRATALDPQDSLKRINEMISTYRLQKRKGHANRRVRRRIAI